MRKFITGLSVAALMAAAAVALPTGANAEASPGTANYPLAVPAVGVATGAVVGFGLYNGWFGAAPAIAGSALPTTAAGAATMGGVAGIGAVALIDGVLQPCRGFHALFGANKDACVNGEYVGYQPRPARYVR
ncbi:hypothetical protein [Undibacter mobilis]|uniref:Uncharacterized protein n=1 Tax=Undibacter mobilis TaxID=2292256 RepID=A0A371B9W6_9BRAD|nr:hypothetical protein [Undibacter mobilis]RDV04151.1 hypothetical protein DXH78_05860 [Undibacter mobilis]